jgi:hypothetical protein
MRVFLDGMLRVLPAACGMILYLRFLRKETAPWEEVMKMFVFLMLASGIMAIITNFMIFVIKNERDYRADYDKRSIFRNDKDSREEESGYH